MKLITKESVAGVEGRFIAAAPVVLFQVHRHRNAWHSTAVSHVAGRFKLHTSLSDAQSFAERWRSQGSSFTIVQRPALLLGNEGGHDFVVRGSSDIEPPDWEDSLFDRVEGGCQMTTLLSEMLRESSWRPVMADLRLEHHLLSTFVLDDSESPTAVRRGSNLERWCSRRPRYEWLDWWSTEEGRFPDAWFDLADGISRSN